MTKRYEIETTYNDYVVEAVTAAEAIDSVAVEFYDNEVIVAVYEVDNVILDDVFA